MQELLVLKGFMHYIVFCVFWDIAVLLAISGQDDEERCPGECSV